MRPSDQQEAQSLELKPVLGPCASLATVLTHKAGIPRVNTIRWSKSETTRSKAHPHPEHVSKSTHRDSFRVKDA